MLDLSRLRRITLSARPRVQRVIGNLFLAPNYNALPGVRIELEHLDRIPAEPVIFAMNHTDRYNYWPFQYQLWRERDRYTATWVKGKYYEHPVLAWFMEMTNNIPTVSRGYLIARDFQSAMGRPPTGEEYSALRDLVEGRVTLDKIADQVPEVILAQGRDQLGRPFSPQSEDYGQAIQGLYGLMMQRFVELNREAMDKNLDIIIFPEGTRSIRLSRGHIGLSQLALKFGRTIVPVGCNNCDQVYPGASPWGRAGHITYRFGHPISPQEQAPFLPEEDFTPFRPEDEARHRDKFQGLVDVVMDRINGLLDERHRYANDKASDGVSGHRRFL